MVKNITQSVFEAFGQSPKVGILMSGKGTNASAILKDQELRSLLDLTVIASDNPDSNAKSLAREHDLDYVELPVRKFENPQERAAYFRRLGAKLGHKGVSAVVYAGFMKISSEEFCETFPGVNVHPADLSITEDGLPVYRGMDALSQMRQDLGFVRSTVHVVDTPVDSGSALAISERLYPEPGETDQALHERLKVHENYIYPQTLKRLGHGALDLADLPVQINLEGQNE